MSRRVVNVVASLGILAGLVWVLWRGLEWLAGSAGSVDPAQTVGAGDGWGVVRAFLWHVALTGLVFGWVGLMGSLVRGAWGAAGRIGRPQGLGQLPQQAFETGWGGPGAMVTSTARTLETTTDDRRPTAGPLDVDPERTPHVLIVGKTGSGRSTLARALLSRFVRRYRAEVVVCDPDGVNWLEQTSAWSTEGIAGAVDAVHGEFSRRQGLLSAGVREDWPYVVLLMEETETVFERLGFVGDEVEERARFELREIARMGRKAGVFLWAVTQVAAGDVFDLHVRRNMTVFCALSEPGVGRMLGIPKEVDLTRLAPGMVYAASAGEVVGFESRASVRLPLSGMGREGGERGAQLVAQPVGRVVVGDLAPVGRLEPGREPTREEAAHMRSLKSRGWSQNRICMEMYGYKDGVVNDFVRAALEGKL